MAQLGPSVAQAENEEERKAGRRFLRFPRRRASPQGSPHITGFSLVAACMMAEIVLHPPASAAIAAFTQAERNPIGCSSLFLRVNKNVVLYLLAGYHRRERFLSKLGKHTLGEGCLYIKRFSDIHLPTLRELVAAAARERKKTHLSTAKA